MKFIECEQGSDAWHAVRAGLCTASCFGDAISTTSRASGTRKAGDPTAAAERYAADLAIERITGHPFGIPPKAWMLDRGHELERRARMAYEEKNVAFVTEAGICISEEVFGYSTDGLVDEDGLIEIKCPIDSAKILAMWKTGDVSEYIHQIQGGMWITGRKWCDFIMYVPDLSCVGKDLFVKRIHRDEDFIDNMVRELARFQGMVAASERVLRPVVAEPVAHAAQEEESPREGRSRLSAILNQSIATAE